MSEPRVSILTATYNQERFIARGVESVLAQSVGDWELLVFDDGSTDATCDIVRRYRDARILLLEHPHSGIWTLGERYNRALAKARGSLLAILDGDDWWPPGKLGLQAPVFEDPEVVLSHGASVLYDEDDRVLAHRPLLRALRGRVPGRDFLEPLLTRRHIPWSPTAMVRAAAVRAVGGFVQPPYEPLVDYPTWAYVAPQGFVRGMTEVLGFYRIRSHSVSRGMAEQVADGHARFVREFLAREGERIGLTDLTRRRYRRWSEAAHDQELARVRMKQGRSHAARDLFRRAFQGGPAWLKARSSLRLFQSAFLGTPRAPI